MCGIVGATAQRPVSKILLEGLRRLEYRGYDSAGIALSHDKKIHCDKAVGKVAELESIVDKNSKAISGIAHTRWATHGKPTQKNAHPHTSGSIALVHNGIIENHENLRTSLSADGYQFKSDTDSEVIAHLFHKEWSRLGDMLEALRVVRGLIKGAYAIALINSNNPEKIYVARSGSPLVIGAGIGENYIASDQLALRPVTDRFIFLQDGDYGFISADQYQLFGDDGQKTQRTVTQIEEDAGKADKGNYRHFMLKEIYEQPNALLRTLEGRLGHKGVLIEAFGLQAKELLKQTQNICIVACGTSYHAGLIAKYWIEQQTNLPVNVEVASEYRYRQVAVSKDTLFIAISQSGETADTLAALNKAKALEYIGYVAICNVISSSLVRESDLLISTNAGPEIGVASTKAFTTQLTALLLLTFSMKSLKNKKFDASEIIPLFDSLVQLSKCVLQLEKEVAQVSLKFAEKHHALFLGRGVHFPVALEGALKLKEISYIHAEAYPSGELKHGPLALVDEDMPVIAVAPSNDLLGKLKSNLEEVKARGGKLFVFADEQAQFESDEQTYVLPMPHVPELLEPIIYSIPLQLLAYHIALVKGTDVDQPRNLAKSVTVE